MSGWSAGATSPSRAWLCSTLCRTRTTTTTRTRERRWSHSTPPESRASPTSWGYTTTYDLTGVGRLFVFKLFQGKGLLAGDGLRIEQRLAEPVVGEGAGGGVAAR